MNVCYRPENGLRCRLGVKPPTQTQTHLSWAGVLQARHARFLALVEDFVRSTESRHFLTSPTGVVHVTLACTVSILPIGAPSALKVEFSSWAMGLRTLEVKMM